MRALQKHYQGVLLGALAIGGLYLISRQNYLLFHSVAELFSIVVACVIFVIAWNARPLYENAYFVLVGVAYLFVGGIDLVHTLAYKGMGVFPGHGANLATQLWIGARGLESLSLLVAPLLLGRKLRAEGLVAAYGVVVGLLFASIFAWHIFPVCYVEGRGLTPFKITSEYVIAAVLAAALALLWVKRERFDRVVLRWLTAALILTIAAEIAFTKYVSVYGPANLVGHLLKIASFYAIYVAIVQTALSRPYNLLFRELKQHERELESARRMQEQMTEFIVHDLRSPLTSLLAGIWTLRERKNNTFSETDAEVADIALASTNWLLTLTNALLDSSRLEHGKMPVQVQDLEPEELVATARENVALWARLCRVELRTEMATEAAVAADRDLTVRVLVNLLSNAIKYSPAGSAVTVRVEAAGGDALAFSVSDEGPGIPEEWTDKVFDRFGMVEAREAGAGTGLGLHFCRLALQAMGGGISLSSEPGKGATVRFTLPAAA